MENITKKDLSVLIEELDELCKQYGMSQTACSVKEKLKIIKNTMDDLNQIKMRTNQHGGNM